jgi:colicin import membrane protein
MSDETSAARIEMLALSLEIANQPETARILRRLTAERDAAVLRAAEAVVAVNTRDRVRMRAERLTHTMEKERDAAIARAEAAERERDELVADISSALVTIAQEAEARIAAEAERDAAQAALTEAQAHRETVERELQQACAEREQLREVAQTFVRRVEAGEVRSKRTYADFKAALAATDRKEPGRE